MDLRHLRYCLAVAECRSFSQAARSLHVSQPAISRQIRDLEQDLGILLFDRAAIPVRPTLDGVRFLERARKVVEEADRLRQDFQVIPPDGRGAGKVLRFAHFGTLIALEIAPCLRKFADRSGGLEIEWIETTPDEALTGLREGRYDVAISGIPEPARTRGLRVCEVWTEAPLAAIPRDHPLAGEPEVPLSIFHGSRCCLWDEEKFPGFGTSFVTSCEREGARPAEWRVINSVESLFAAVTIGEWIGYAGRPAARLCPPEVVMLPIAGDAVPMPIGLIWDPLSRTAALCESLASQMSRDRLAIAAPAAKGQGVVGADVRTGTSGIDFR